MKKLSLIIAMLLVAATAVVIHQAAAPAPYVPKAQLCVAGVTGLANNRLCSTVPSYIGPDPPLKKGLGYSGLFGPPPTSAANDVQTPFDNLAWQMFVALNWAASAVNQPPAKGLTVAGPRVFQTYRKVSALFGNSPVTATCSNPQNLPVFSIGSDGHGNPAPNNEEYFQASTNLPLIDINGNWTIYERRVNDIEAQYLLAPNGDASQTLTTQTGQLKFINNQSTVAFTASSLSPTGANGSIEIKTSWRIINQSAGDDPSRYYTEKAIVTVPADLVNQGKQVCATVNVGLVGMHIIQRNPVDPLNGNLLPQWIWATFEHVDNVPMAQSPCNIVKGCPPNNWLNQPSCGAASPNASVRYSFYNQNSKAHSTNIAPVPAAATFHWNSTAPYAKGATAVATSEPQATRCWSIFNTTAQLNAQWQSALAAVKTPLQNYMLVGTQWGGSVESREGNPLPTDAVPAMLSNSTLETYIQNYTKATGAGGPGSCVSCHGDFATLAVGSPAAQSDFSFLPGLAQPATARRKLETPGQYGTVKSP
ncbi:MAG: hypothetical protein QOD75_1230 [Blastocatellia bacterium]|jgi:hypothetical protein|nr:hypothetical protein [Blastocatellia bacterium]